MPSDQANGLIRRAIGVPMQILDRNPINRHQKLIQAKATSLARELHQLFAACCAFEIAGGYDRDEKRRPRDRVVDTLGPFRSPFDRVSIDEQVEIFGRSNAKKIHKMIRQRADATVVALIIELYVAP